MSTLAFAAIFGNLLGGALTGRLGGRQALIGGLVVSAAGPLAMAYAQSPWQAFTAAALIGFGAGIIWPRQDALLAQLLGADQRSAGFSVRHATMNARLGLGALAAAAIVKVGAALSRGRGTGLFTALIPACGLVASLPCGLVTGCRPPSTRLPSAGSVLQSRRLHLRNCWSAGPVRPFQTGPGLTLE